MKKKLGFTLVELLAVIVILAVILIIAMPKISDVIKNSREASLETTAKLIASQAEKKFAENKVLDNSNTNIKCSDIVSISEDDYEACSITFDSNGNAKVTVLGKGKLEGLAVYNGTKDNANVVLKKTYRKCTTNDILVENLEFVDGQYTYTYDGINGWGVVITDKDSTDPVTSELCSTINDKPIISMESMFEGSKAISIDLSSFDTSNVVNMAYMFDDTSAEKLNGLNNFNTSNVTSMGGMFYSSNATSLDLSSFDTSNVEIMFDMFNSSSVLKLDLSNFNTKNVTDMSNMFDSSSATTIIFGKDFKTNNVTTMNHMFSSSCATSLDLSSFDTSNVEDMFKMFESSSATTIIFGKDFNTKNVTDMSSMFESSVVESLDLSSFDMSNVEDIYDMFYDAKATIGYARTCEDAARFNASDDKPDGLTFIVKDTTC